MTGLAKVARHRQSKFCSKSLGYRKEGGIVEGGPHVVIEIVDPEARAFCPFDLGSQLTFDLAQIGIVLIEVVRGRKEKTVLVHERGNSGPAEHGTPAVVLPLGIEREVNPDRHGGMTLQNLHRLLVPRGRKHHRHGHRKTALDQFLETEIYAVSHPRIVGADDQVNRFGGGRMAGLTGLTNDVRWRDGQEKSTNQQGTKQPRASGGGSQVGLLFHPSGAKKKQIRLGTPLSRAGRSTCQEDSRGREANDKKTAAGGLCQATVIFGECAVQESNLQDRKST